MGEFINVFAIRAPAEAVAGSLAAYAETHGCPATVLSGASDAGSVSASGDVDASDVTLYAAPDGWTVALWPASGGIPAAAARLLSRELDTVASVIAVYDGAFWTHVLFASGEERNRFASVPDYFEDDPARAEDLRARWAGDPALVASVVDRPVDEVGPYLVHESSEDEPEVDEHGALWMPPEVSLKAFDEDEFAIGDPWVFVDYWRRVGIVYPAPTYPDPTPTPAYGIDFSPDWRDRLPSGAEWTL